MATTSGTIGQTVITAQDFIDHAIRRCNKLAETASAEVQMALKQDLFFLLINLVNRGIEIWTITKLVMGMQPATRTYTLPVGTIEVLNVLYRIPQLAFGSPISATGFASSAFDQNTTTYCDAGVNGWIGANFTSPLTVTSVGFMPFGTHILSLVIEYSNDGILWFPLFTPPAAQVYTDGLWTFWDIDNGKIAQYCRIRETAGGDLAAREMQFQLPQTNEITMARLNRDDYTNLPDKGVQMNTPPQFYAQRTLDSQAVTVWGVPFNPWYQLVFWYHRQLQDVGALSNRIELPQRWYLAMRDQMAVQASFQLPDVDPTRQQMLMAMAKDTLQDAEAEERDKSPIYWTPNISYYTR